jgi:hypothetical protein
LGSAHTILSTIACSIVGADASNKVNREPHCRFPILGCEFRIF